MTKAPSLSRAKWLKAPGLQRLFAVIAGAGGEARVAGGAVRNALMKLPIADVDLATTLPPERVKQACEAAGFKVVPTGIDHGTVTVVIGHHPYEVTTLRADVETFGRHARVAFHDDWQADAVRRDFTMNALYCDARGNIYDYTEGYRDILARKVRFVGDASKRIGEDYLRVLRFFRFHARFGNGAPDRVGLAACARAAAKLDSLSAERLRQEMLKLLEAPGAIATLKVMAKHGILRHILSHREDWRVLSRLPADGVLRLAVLAADPDSLKARLRLSNDEADRISNVLAAVPPTPSLRPAEQRRVLYQLGPATWRDAVRLAWARSRAPLTDRSWKRLLTLPERWPVPKLPIGGHDLIAAGHAAGPGMGAALQVAEDWWVASDFTASKEELLRRVAPPVNPP